MQYSTHGFETILNGKGQCPYTGKETMIRINDNIRMYVNEYGSYRFVYYLSGKSTKAISALQVMKDDRGVVVANVITIEQYRQKGYAKTLFYQAKQVLKQEIKHSQNLSELGKIFANKIK